MLGLLSLHLARVLASKGRHNETRVMLAEISNWFTEGFDVADLNDANAVFDKLSG
jgi:hypothetical protein